MELNKVKKYVAFLYPLIYYAIFCNTETNAIPLIELDDLRIGKCTLWLQKYILSIIDDFFSCSKSIHELT